MSGSGSNVIRRSHGLGSPLRRRCARRVDAHAYARRKLFASHQGAGHQYRHTMAAAWDTRRAMMARWQYFLFILYVARLHSVGLMKRRLPFYLTYYRVVRAAASSMAPMRYES